MDRENVFKYSVEILQQTNDGDDLQSQDLKLVEGAVNGFLTERGYVVLYKLWHDVTEGIYAK